ncbi:hypothetical protein Trydic_g11719 [Trypoxylus dichotomus]
MGNSCNYPYEQTDVPEPDTANAPLRSLICKEHHATRRRRSGATDELYAKNKHPIRRPSSGPFKPHVSASKNYDPRIPWRYSMVTRGTPPGLTAGHPACSSPPRDEALTLRQRCRLTRAETGLSS